MGSCQPQCVSNGNVTQLQYVVWTNLAPISWKLAPGGVNSGDAVIVGLFVVLVDTHVGISDGITVHLVSVATVLVGCGAEPDSLTGSRELLLGATVTNVDGNVVEDELGLGEIAVRGVLRLASAKPNKAMRVANVRIFVCINMFVMVIYSH